MSDPDKEHLEKFLQKLELEWNLNEDDAELAARIWQAINKYKASQTLSDWRPIKTAPRYGTQILLTDGKNDMASARWEHEAWVIGECRIDSHKILYELANKPTHWMHLPPQPKE